MFPVGFLLQFDTKVLRYESVLLLLLLLKKKKNALIFWGWLFVTYGIDLVSIPRYYILVSYRSQNYGIEPSLQGTICLASQQTMQPTWKKHFKGYPVFGLAVLAIT